MCDRYKQKLVEKIEAQVKKQFYSLAAQNPQAFPNIFPESQQQTVQVPSCVGSVETSPYPMDLITGPMPCSLVVPIGRAGKRKVGTGLAIPGR